MNIGHAFGAFLCLLGVFYFWFAGQAFGDHRPGAGGFVVLAVVYGIAHIFAGAVMCVAASEKR